MRKAIIVSAMLLVLSACGTAKGGSQMSDSGNHQNNHASAQMVTKQKKSADSNQTKTDNMNQARKNQDNGHVLNVTAHNFAFNKDKYVVQSGEVTIHFKSVQGTHGFALYKSPSSTEKIVNIIGKGTKTVKLSPGTYYIHCSVVCGGGHGNMDATLVVK